MTDEAQAIVDQLANGCNYKMGTPMMVLEIPQNLHDRILAAASKQPAVCPTCKTPAEFQCGTCGVGWYDKVDFYGHSCFAKGAAGTAKHPTPDQFCPNPYAPFPKRDDDWESICQRQLDAANHATMTLRRIRERAEADLYCTTMLGKRKESLSLSHIIGAANTFLNALDGGTDFPEMPK